MSDTCKVSDWKNNAPRTDDRQEKLFVRFEAGSDQLITDYSSSGGTLAALPG
jgi:hypothetical protein